MEGKHYILGVDIGGTSINVGAVPTGGGPVIGMRSLPTDAHEGGEFVFNRIVNMVREILTDEVHREHFRQEDVIGMGLGSPGPLDRRMGVVFETINLDWSNFPLRDKIAEKLGLEAELDNDANAATLGEWWQGAARGFDHVLGVTIGTGIGGGIVLAGEVYHGASDVAAEFGHMTIDSAGRKCGCGNHGCLEAYASGPAIAARAVEGIEAGATSIMLEMVHGDLKLITAEKVFEAIIAGDRYANEVMLETAKLLGVGLANLINILNPGIVVLSGGVARAGDHLLVPLRKEIEQRAFAKASESCRVCIGELGDMAGVIGAAAIFHIARLGPL